MKDKKYVILIFIVVILIIVTLMILLMQNNDDVDKPNTLKPSTDADNPVVEDKYDYLVIGDYSLWSYNKEKDTWSKRSDFNVDNKKFDIFINNNYFGNYYLKFVKSWNIFDENDNYVDYDGNLIAHTQNIDVAIKNYEITEIDSQEKKEILNIIGDDVDLDNLDVNEKIVVDLDNNGVNDKIVNVSNIHYTNDDVSRNNIFNLIYVVINGDVNILINEKIKEKDMLIAPSYNVNYLLNINNEKTASIIITEGFFSEAGDTANLLFQFKDNKYKKIIDN